MSSGGPGDHWLTDLFIYQVAVFGEPIDSLLRDIRRFGGERLLTGDPWASRLEGAWPLWRSPTEQGESLLELRRMAPELQRLRDQLYDEAVSAGWELEGQ